MSAIDKEEIDSALRDYNSAPRDDSVYAKEQHEKRVMDAVRYIYNYANDRQETPATRAYARSILDEQIDPKDIERAGIEAAARSMVETAESTALFSQGDSVAPEQQLSQQELEALVQAVTRRIPGAPEIVVADSARALFGAQVPAGTTPAGGVVGGKVYLFRDGIASVRDASRVIFHELFHYGLKNILPKEQYIQTLLRIQAIDPQVREYARRWRASVEGQARRSTMPAQDWNALAVEEALADIAEDITDPETGQVGSQFKGTVRNLAKWLADIAEMLGMRSLAQAVRRMTMTETEKFVLQAIQTQQAPTSPGAESPAFKRWFGDSKVVDAEGKPLVVYHGTGNSFSTFDRHAYTEREGFYFSSDPAFAGDFAEGSADGIAYDDREEAQGPSVMPVYLSIQNPVDVRNGWPKEVAEQLDDTINYEWLTTLPPSDFWLAMDGADGSAIKSKLESLGYDGLIATEVGAPVYVAFRPEQIKSAIGNNGNFDPANPDIRFSTKRALPAETPKQIVTAADTIADTIKHFAKKAVTFGAFSQDLAQIASRVLPSVKRFTQLMTERDVVKAKNERAVEKILQEYDRLPAAAKGTGPGSVNYLLREMTTSNKWGFKPDWLQNVDVDPEMEAKFNAASPQARALVTEVLRHGHTTLQQMKAAVLENVESDFDFQIADAKKRGDDAEARELEKQKAKSLTGYGSLFAISGQTPYAPLKRFGNHVVLAFSKAYLDAEANGNTEEMRRLQQEGENHYVVQFAETRSEAKAIERGMAGKYDLVQVFEKDDTNPLMYAGHDVMGTFYRLRNMVADADASIDVEAKKSVNRLLNDIHLTLLGEQSARQAERNRKNIAGADLDMMRAFATQGRATAHFIASLHNNGKVYDQLREMKKEAGARTAGRGEREMYYNEFAKRFGMSADYRPSPIIDKALGATSVWMLLTNPAYYLQNATQPFMMSLPMMGGKHGYARSAGMLIRSYRELMPILKDGKLTEDDYGKLPKDVRAAVEKLVDAGRIDISLDQDLGRWRSTEEGGLQKVGSVVEKLRSVAQTVESINRLSTAIAAYRLEVERGASAEQATAYADKVIYDTHGDYSGFNAPRITRTGGWRLVTQFKKFQLIQLSLMAKLLKQSFSGASPTEKLIGRKALAFTLSHALAMGGVMGLPGFTAIAWVLGKVFGDDDEPDNPELALRRAIGNDTMADLLVKGAPKLAGVDLSGKLGMGGMLSIMPFAEVDFSRDGYAQMLTALAGPFLGGLLPKAADGVSLMAGGNYYQGLEKMLPTGLGNAMKGARMATEGMTQRNGDVVLTPEDISFMDAAMAAIGLPTNKVTDRQFLQAAKFQYDEFYQERTAELRKKYNEAYRSGDAQARLDVQAEWMELQDSRRRNGYVAQPLSQLLRAPMEQARRERDTVGGVQARQQNAGFVQQTRDLLE